MAKYYLIALGAMFWLSSAAQNEVEFTDSTNVNESMEPSGSEPTGSMYDMVQGYTNLTAGNLTECNDVVYSLNRCKGLFKKHHIEQAIEVYPTVSTDKVSQADVTPSINTDDINNTGIGFSFGYALGFIPCYEEAGKLHMNKAGFVYSLGLIASLTRSDRYGTTCDFLGKVGLETCRNRKLGIGGDFLFGYGKACGDIFWFDDTTTDEAPKSSSPYNKWTPKYGGQVWVKTGLLGNTFKSNTDILLFARLIINKEPNDITPLSKIHYNVWRKETWSFGVIFRYRMFSN